MKLTAIKFTHAVIRNLNEAQDKKPMGLFLTGSSGIGKTHLCVAAAKKAAEYGATPLFVNTKKAEQLYQGFVGDGERWDRKINEMLAGKDLIILDDTNTDFLCTQLLAKTMEFVLTHNKAIMVSSNHLIPVKTATPGFINPLTDKRAHNFFYLSDLQGESYHSQWWHSPEVQAADALSRLGQYQGCMAAGVIIEDAVSIDDIAKKLSVPVDLIRQVGHYFLPEEELLSPDYFFSDLSKSKHRAVFMECHITDNDSQFSSITFEQFLNVIQKVHDEGVKLVVKTNSYSLFLETLRGFLEQSMFVAINMNRSQIIDRLKHLFPDFS